MSRDRPRTVDPVRFDPYYSQPVCATLLSAAHGGESPTGLSAAWLVGGRRTCGAAEKL